jgi:cytochrome c oxidase accessory protein FixG
MFDPDTLIITYDGNRGEPRGPRNKSVDHKAKGLGDCVDCGICVQVCPTGIDIRNGLQYECIGCGACVDGCNQVMAKMGYPKGLIRYSTENALKQNLHGAQVARRMVRPRVLVYTGILAVVAIAALLTLVSRVPVKVDVVRDRAVISRDPSDPVVQNVYRLQIMNTQERAAHFTITASGIDGIRLLGDPQPIALGPATAKWVPVRIEVPRQNAQPGSNRIEFTVVAAPQDGGEPITVVENTTFIVQ